MFKNGTLNKKERETLLKAAEILNNWCNAHDDSDDYLDDFAYSSASEAAGAIHNFLYETRGE